MTGCDISHRRLPEKALVLAVERNPSRRGSRRRVLRRDRAERCTPFFELSFCFDRFLGIIMESDYVCRNLLDQHQIAPAMFSVHSHFRANMEAGSFGDPCFPCRRLKVIYHQHVNHLGLR